MDLITEEQCPCHYCNGDCSNQDEYTYDGFTCELCFEEHTRIDSEGIIHSLERVS